MCSREGEEVTFSTPIILNDYPKMDNWLTKLESQMEISLAELLSMAMDQLAKYHSDSDMLNQDEFLEWIESFLVLNVMSSGF